MSDPEVPSWTQSHREQRLVKNELAFRAHNERRAELEEAGGVGSEEEVPFVCECGNPDCTAPIEISIEVYERIHERDDRFVVKRGHVSPEVERVVDEAGRYLVVEKLALGP
jgi:hypothetical protein